LFRPGTKPFKGNPPESENGGKKKAISTLGKLTIFQLAIAGGQRKFLGKVDRYEVLESPLKRKRQSPTKKIKVHHAQQSHYDIPCGVRAYGSYLDGAEVGFLNSEIFQG